MEPKEITVTWHPATETPGKRSTIMLFKHKGHKQYSASHIRFLSPGILPAEFDFSGNNGEKKLAIAWAYADDIQKQIPAEWEKAAKAYAWSFWKE